MDYNIFFKSIIEQDNCAIMICDKTHKIIYMNPTAAQNYAKRGGTCLIGKSLLDCHNENSCKKIMNVVSWFEKSVNNNRVHTFYNQNQNKDIYI